MVGDLPSKMYILRGSQDDVETPEISSSVPKLMTLKSRLDDVPGELILAASFT